MNKKNQTVGVFVCLLSLNSTNTGHRSETDALTENTTTVYREIQTLCFKGSLLVRCSDRVRCRDRHGISLGGFSPKMDRIIAVPGLITPVTGALYRDGCQIPKLGCSMGKWDGFGIALLKNAEMRWYFLRRLPT